jgi:hypothetical protein
LGQWLKDQRLYFCLRLRKNHFIEIEPEIWLALKELGLTPGMSFYLRGIKVTKTKQIKGFDLASKWVRKYGNFTAEEGWFILTNLGSLEAAIVAYKKRFGIEEMFRDFKTGGYNNVKGQRLTSLWTMSWSNCSQMVEELLKLNREPERPCYRQNDAFPR